MNLKHYFGITVLVGVSLSFAQREAKHSYSLEKDFKATAPLSSRGGTITLSASRAKATLTVQVGSSTQNFKLETIDDTGSPAQGNVLVEDFDFDGYNDIGVPSGIGYGGVNEFYDVQRYNPTSKRFELLKAKDFEVSNPAFDSVNKILYSSSRSGPAWYSTRFKFLVGKPYRYQSDDPVVFNVFPATDNGIFQTTTFDPKGQILKRELTEETDTNKSVAVMRTVPLEKMFLYNAPKDSAKTARYIVNGDKIQILEVQETNIPPVEVQWVKAAYQSQKAGRIVAWLRLGQ